MSKLQHKTAVMGWLKETGQWADVRTIAEQVKMNAGYVTDLLYEMEKLGMIVTQISETGRPVYAAADALTAEKRQAALNGRMEKNRRQAAERAEAAEYRETLKIEMMETGEQDRLLDDLLKAEHEDD